MPLALPFRVRDEWGRLLASLTRSVFAQFADDGKRCFVAQIKREWFGLVLLGCCFRVHVLGCGRAASWTEPDHGRAAARERGCRAGIRTQGERRIGPSATPIPLAWSPFVHSGTRQKAKSPTRRTGRGLCNDEPQRRIPAKGFEKGEWPVLISGLLDLAFALYYLQPKLLPAEVCKHRFTLL